jgi:ribonuclease HI
MALTHKHLKFIDGNCPWKFFAAIADFRRRPANPVIIQQLPTVNDCSNLVARLKSCRRLPLSDVLMFKDCVPKSPFNIAFLRDASTGIMPDVFRQYILSSMVEGFSSRYRGGSFLQRDFSSKLKVNENKLALEKMMKEVSKGYCLGPFDVCPFPSKWSSSQAYISQLFFLPKHKWMKDSGFRLISNKSFPQGRSFNDLTERQDCTAFFSGYKYFTFQSFMEQVKRLGPNCLFAQFDVRDAYKNIKIKPDEWQQVYCIGDKFFVDLGGMFGSRSAGDSWQLVMEFIAICLRRNCHIEELYYYVDNNIILTPPIEGKVDKFKADKDFKSILEFLGKAGVPYHDTCPPSTSGRFLGWLVDTAAMTVTCPSERMDWIRSILNSGSKTITRKVIQSVTGILEFLAAVLPFLRAPLGWLQKRNTAQESGAEKCDENFKSRFKYYFHYIEALLYDWQGTASMYASLSTEDPDAIIYSDASGDVGYGAIEMKSQRFGHDIWSLDELKSAQRRSSVSSTHLEVAAIMKAIRTFAKPFQAVQIYADSAAAIFILQKRYDRHSDISQSLIMAMDRYCRDRGIALFFTHVSRTHSLIRVVDDLSKMIMPTFLDGWERSNMLDFDPIIF